MGIANQAGLAGANTEFLAAMDAVFAGGPQGVHQVFTEIIPSDGLTVELDVIGSFPRAREWLGSKQIKDLRAYTQSIALSKYEATIGIARQKVEYDKSGVVGRALRNFVQQNAYWYDDILIAALMANTATGYDGVSLLNDSHPNVASTGTSDNLSTSALSFATFKTGVQALEDMSDEDGKPLGVFPTHLLVGPAQRRIGMEVTGSDRPVPVDTSGALDTTSNVNAVATLPNYIGGEVTLIVSPFVTGNEWFLMDLGKPAKPLILMQNRAPEAIEITDMNASSRFWNDEYHFSIEADIKPAPGMWNLIYGSVTA